MNITDTIKEFNEYTNLAVKILQGDTDYIRGKKIISDIFRINRDSRFETIMFRLTIIDSYYSTQMNKRLFGLDDLAYRFTEITRDDQTLKSMCIEYIAEPKKDSDLDNLFNGRYGIRKTGHDAGHAVSLITKYLYFLTEYQFPIYDNLVKISYPLIKRKYPALNINSLDEKFSNLFFDNISELNTVTKTNDFNRLDNFLWLIGKLTEGSLSLILNKKRYLQLVEKMKIPKGTRSAEADRLTRVYIKDNIDNLDGLFSIEEIKFLKFSYDLAITESNCNQQT